MPKVNPAAAKHATTTPAHPAWHAPYVSNHPIALGTVMESTQMLTTIGMRFMLTFSTLLRCIETGLNAITLFSHSVPLDCFRCNELLYINLMNSE